MSNSKIFDTHAHYDDSKFDGTRDETLQRLFSKEDVGVIVNVGTCAATNRASLTLAEKYPCIYAACGYHPHDIADVTDESAALDELKTMLSHPKCLAIGEIGLDFYYDTDWSELQKKWFRAQMSLAYELDMPVIVHDRDAHGACFEIVCDFPGVKGVFHSYSGSAEMAKELVKKGWYISFSGVVTFNNATRLAEVVRSVPAERLLLETDCPYLAPVPVRGTVNNSGNIKYTAKKISDIKGIDYHDLLDITFENASRFYGI